MRQWKPVAGAGRTVHRGRTVGNAWDHPRAVCVVRYPPSGSRAYDPSGEAATVARKGAAVAAESALVKSIQPGGLLS